MSRKSAGSPTATGVPPSAGASAPVAIAQASVAGRVDGSPDVCFCSSANTFMSDEQVERVVRRGAVGAETDRDARPRAPAGSGTRPTASFMFETGLVTIVAPRSATSSSSSSSSQTPCASTARSLSRPSRSRYCAGRHPCASMQSCTSCSVSERCVCIGTCWSREISAMWRSDGSVTLYVRVRGERALHPRAELRQRGEPVDRVLGPGAVRARLRTRGSAGRRWRARRCRSPRGRRRAGASTCPRSDGAPVRIISRHARRVPQ